MPTTVTLKNKEKQRRYVTITLRKASPGWTTPVHVLHPGEEKEFVVAEDAYIEVREGNGLETQSKDSGAGV